MVVILVFSILIVVLPSVLPALASRLQHRRDRLLMVAHRYIGVPYRWGGDSPRSGFDCSGFVRYVYWRALGIRLPRTTWEQMADGRRVGRLRPGDVVFFFGGEHEGLYLGHGRFEDAPHTGTRVGVRSLASYGGYYTARRYLGR